MIAIIKKIVWFQYFPALDLKIALVLYSKITAKVCEKWIFSGNNFIAKGPI